MGNYDPYSDSSEPVVVKQPKFTRVGEPTFLCNPCFRIARNLSRSRRQVRGTDLIQTG